MKDTFFSKRILDGTRAHRLGMYIVLTCVVICFATDIVPNVISLFRPSSLGILLLLHLLHLLD